MITDVRGHEDLFSLDKDVFSLENQKTNFARGLDFDKSEYMEEMKNWLKHYLPCQEVFVFDYTIRRQERSNETLQHGATGIAKRVHCGRFISKQTISN